MKNTSRTIIFFGTEEFSLTVLIGLIEAGYTIGAVVTKPDSKRGRGQNLISPPIKVFANHHAIPVWQPARLNDIKTAIEALGAVTGVLASYGKIVPSSILESFTPGIINVHPSLLPRYRGPTPIETAIKNGDKVTGVSIMKLVSGMDAGPVYASSEYLLNGSETRPDLYQTLGRIGTDLLLEILPSIIKGSLNPTAQNEKRASYTQLLQKSDANLDLGILTAEEAERTVRAYLGFPKSKLQFGRKSIIVTKSHVSMVKKTALSYKCKDGKFLTVDELIAPSGRTMNTEAFLRGYAT